MKVILDTNVLISGIFFGGPPLQILKAWHGSNLELLVSYEILEEYVEVGERLMKKYPNVDPFPIIELIGLNATIVSAYPLERSVSKDPDDDKFLACATSGKGSHVISGDKHLLDVLNYQGIKIVSPRQFVDKYLK